MVQSAGTTSVSLTIEKRGLTPAERFQVLKDQLDMLQDINLALVESKIHPDTAEQVRKNIETVLKVLENMDA